LKTLTLIATVVLFSSCTQIVTAPIAVAGKVVTTSIDIVGAAGGAVVHTISGGEDK